ncbi:hornerin isoform X2 [Antennarius striatus]|uniref:hornerin isoform X2 n=1 Tax=Antennarius striatus TaxID=241820 RepID=UPI0035AFBE58
MCDKEKDHKKGKTADSKIQQIKHFQTNQCHHHHEKQNFNQEQLNNDTDDTCSTAGDSIVSDHHSNHRHDHHHHHYHHKQNHRHASLSETPLSSSVVLSASSSSSSSATSSSTSSSSSSFSSSSSVSSSSLSSETTSECSDRYPLKKHQHSQSCNDISRKHRYFEEGDETAPLIDKSRCTKRLTAKQQCGKGTTVLSGMTQGTLKNTKRVRRGSVNDGSVRKTKSMEALTGPKERKLHGNEDKIKKGEAIKNLMKEKKKFSAFLNEITRQVLSPMRLTTLGVTDAQRPCSPGQASVRSSKENSSTEKLKQQPRCPAGVDSSSSSKSVHHHHGHGYPDSTHHTCHKCMNHTDGSCLERCHSCSQTPHHGSHSPSHKHMYHHQQGEQHSFGHHHRHHHKTSHHRQHHSPVCHHGVHYSATHHHHHKESRSPGHDHHHGDYHASSHHHEHGDHHSQNHHHGQGDHHIPGHHHHQGDHSNAGHHHNHGDQQNPGHHHHHYQGDQHNPEHQHQHRGHHNSSHRNHHGHRHKLGHHHHEDLHSASHHHHLEGHHKPHNMNYHGDYCSPGHYCRPEDHHRSADQPGHGDPCKPLHHHHEEHHRKGHYLHCKDHQNMGHHHQHDEPHRHGHQHEHGGHHSVSYHHHQKGHHHQHHHDDCQTPCHHHEQEDQHQHYHEDHHHRHHHEDHQSSGHQHQKDHCTPCHSYYHSSGHHLHKDHHSSGYLQEQEDHHSPGHHHHHEDRHSPSHHQGLEDHHSPSQHLEHGNPRSPGYCHGHEDHQRPVHHHGHKDHQIPVDHGVHHNPIHHHCHEGPHSPSHHLPYGDQHSPGHHYKHEDNHSPGHHHQYDDHHSPSHHHGHEGHHSQDHHHELRDHHSPGHFHHYDDHHSVSLHHGHKDHHSTGHPSDLEDHYNPDNHHEHGDHHSPSHHYGHEDHFSPGQHHDFDNQGSHLTGHSISSQPSHEKQESNKLDSLMRVISTSCREEEHSSFTGPSFYKEEASELSRIIAYPERLQQQNVGLHQNFLKSTVRMECLGKELVTSQKCLETELKQTRMEPKNLTEGFKRPQDNCSPTPQTNLLEPNSLVAQRKEGEPEPLNQSISALRGELADAKFDNIVETMNFMDSNNYGIAKVGGQEQSLGSVPEEEESDWSEMGDEIPRFILTGAGRGQTRRHQDSESGCEEVIRPHSPCPLPISHLQLSVHNENLCDSMTAVGAYRITSSPTPGSAILMRSASLEEIPLSRHHTQKELRDTEAMMDLHHQGFNAIENLDNEVIHHWRGSNDRDTAIGRVMDSRTSEAESSMVSLQSAERMLNHFICEPQPDGAKDQGRTEVLGWVGGIPDEVLKGERTKL